MRSIGLRCLDRVRCRPDSSRNSPREVGKIDGLCSGVFRTFHPPAECADSYSLLAGAYQLLDNYTRAGFTKRGEHWTKSAPKRDRRHPQPTSSTCRSTYR